MAVAARELVRRLIAQHRVVIFSKTYCPYSMDAKTVLRSATDGAGSGSVTGDNVVVLELDHRDDESDIQSALCELTGRPFVPSVWVGGNFIGGSTETRELFEGGKLEKMVRSAMWPMSKTSS